MHNLGTATIIALTIALVLAIGWVVFAVGRVVISMIREVRAQSRPPRQVQHPEFGTLTLDSELWSGRVMSEDSDIGFVVAGTETAPDAALLERVRSAIAKLPELERMAVEFICRQESKIRGEDFTLESLDYLWEDKPDQFAMEFTLAGDDDGIWRVEFEEGQPKFVGRDDLTGKRYEQSSS